MAKEASLEFRLRKTDETGNYLLEEIKHDLMSAKYKKTCKYLNYVEHLLILVSTVTGCVLISAFPSLVFVPVGIISSAIGIKITRMWRRWDKPQNFSLSFIDEPEKQTIIKKTVEVDQYKTK